MAASEEYDLVVVGSGFGSLFFLKKLLALRPSLRVAVVEWGYRRDHAWQIEQGRNSDIPPAQAHVQPDGQKPWNYTIGLGGGTNCWWGQAVRMLPADFEMRLRYGVMEDWPFSYDELEPYYVEAETIMSVSGDASMGRVSPRSAPFPLPPHRLNAVDEIMIRARPEHHFPISTARAPVSAGRGVCCASARCHLCPVDAKFTAFNGLADVLEHPAVTFTLGAEVRTIELENGRAVGVTCRHRDGERQVRGGAVVLGANGIHSPAILLRSGIDHPATGIGLREQLGAEFEVLLEGLDSFDGGTVTTSLNYALYDGPHRREAGAALLFFDNRLKYGVRPEFGRWRQYVPLIVNVEDAARDDNRVTLAADGRARVEHPGVSDYALAGLRRAEQALPEVLAPLPVERIVARGIRPTESHIQCTLRAGADPASSVVDGAGVHHAVRNLVVVGSATMPTCPPANPSLTLAAMALRSAELWART
jgi:choline dehydrogenase-like flavoprotein